MRTGRVELPPLTRHGPKPCASANSATSATHKVSSFSYCVGLPVDFFSFKEQNQASRALVHLNEPPRHKWRGFFVELPGGSFLRSHTLLRPSPRHHWSGFAAVLLSPS